MDIPEAFGIGSAAAVLMLASDAAVPTTTNQALRTPVTAHLDDRPPQVDDWATCWPSTAEVRPRSPSR